MKNRNVVDKTEEMKIATNRG